jgi:RsiW-degrading membrane proteinase PrsW (M82 family)
MSDGDIQIRGGTAPVSQSTDVIHAHGEVATKKAVLLLIGIAIVLLILGGLIAWYINPDKSKDLWVIIGPMISGALVGTTSFLAGERQGMKRKR